MPLTTYMGFTITPDVWIKVSDGGGSGGNDHTVDLTVHFDTDVLVFVTGSDNCQEFAPGVCGWTDVFCPAGGRTFTVDFNRVDGKRTLVSSLAVDYDSNETHPNSKAVPRAAQPLSKKKKKGRKARAGKKA